LQASEPFCEGRFSGKGIVGQRLRGLLNLLKCIFQELSRIPHWPPEPTVAESSKIRFRRFRRFREGD
jgi:hypothetical protein